KDLREFLPVKQYIGSKLSPYCESFPSFEETKVCKTPNVQHLHSQCQATLLPGIRDETILSALHPTPALCGLPKEKALSLIADLEPFDRGLYGGVIGWSTEEESEWAV